MAEEAGRPRFFGPMLIASNFAVTVAFYRDTLGLSVEGDTPYAECKSESSIFSILDARFWAHANQAEMPVVRGSNSVPDTVFAIQVPNVDDTFERLMSLEVKFLSPPTNRPQMGLRNAFLRDPDGRTIELTTPLVPPSR